MEQPAMSSTDYILVPLSSLPLSTNTDFNRFSNNARVAGLRRCMKCKSSKLQDFLPNRRDRCKRCIEIDKYEEVRAQLIAEGKPIIISSPTSSRSSPNTSVSSTKTQSDSNITETL